MKSKVSINRSTLSRTDQQIIRIGAYVLGTAIIGTAGFLTVKHFIRKASSNKTELLSINDGTPSNYAKRLKMAFDNDGMWGTNVEDVRQVFTEIKSKEQYEQVANEYQSLTKSNKGALSKDLADELTSSELYEMANILFSKPQKTGQKPTFDWVAAIAIARRLKASFDYTILSMPSTDKGALKAALDSIPSLKGFVMVKMVYQKLYGRDLEKDLDGELDLFDFSWRDILTKKPKQ